MKPISTVAKIIVSAAVLLPVAMFARGAVDDHFFASLPIINRFTKSAEEINTQIPTLQQEQGDTNAEADVQLNTAQPVITPSSASDQGKNKSVSESDTKKSNSQLRVRRSEDGENTEHGNEQENEDETNDDGGTVAPTPTPATPPTVPPTPVKPTTPAPTPAPTPTVASYTMAQVAAANTSSKCWTTIGGNVYDLTPFINRHPGGAGAIMLLCGKDGSSMFTAQHGGQGRPISELNGLQIGILK